MKRRKFISLTGKGAVFMTGSGLWLSCKSNAHSDYESDLKERSFSAFRRFEEVWDFNDFWKRGNTFDACLRFADAVQQQWPDDPRVKEMQQSVITMLKDNLAFFQRFDPGSLWADDFGWWGLMGLNARKFLLQMGEKDLANDYLKLSVDLCWEYKKSTAYDHTPDAKPVPHGCRNGDANGQSPGVKNTVTNVLLFLLSSRIYRLTLAEGITGNEKFLEMAYLQWVWFNQWFKLEEYQYLKEFAPGAALVQERPMAFFEGSDYQEKIHPPWAEGWVWTGDQGMLAAALTDMRAVKNELADWLKDNQPELAFDVDHFEERVSGLLRLIGGGISQALVAGVDGIFREAPCYSSFGPQHGRDYVAGRGIMLRYISDPEISRLLGSGFSEPVRKTADAVWRTREESTNQFQPEFTSEANDRQYIAQFRELWGLADDVVKWDLEKMVEKNKNGVCQAVGLDALGAAVRSL